MTMVYYYNFRGNKAWDSHNTSATQAVKMRGTHYFLVTAIQKGHDQRKGIGEVPGQEAIEGGQWQC
jgi:hypothetical protein